MLKGGTQGVKFFSGISIILHQFFFSMYPAMDVALYRWGKGLHPLLGTFFPDKETRVKICLLDKVCLFVWCLTALSAHIGYIMP